jgi:hypothetical protein
MHALEWFGVVAALFERVHGLCLLLRVVPGYSIYARRAFPLVFRHSSHGKRFAAERAGQQALQGLDLAPSAILRGLHDTRLEPTHVLIDLGPVDGVPVCRVVGAAPASGVAVICIASLVG